MGIPADRKPDVRFDRFQVDLRTGEVRTEDRKFYLQEQPFQVLQLLLECPGELVTREDLKKRLWPSDTFVDFDQSLNKAVNRLREALEDSAERPRFIETLPRRGYRFIAPLKDGSGSAPSTFVHTGDMYLRPSPALDSNAPAPSESSTRALLTALGPWARFRGRRSASMALTAIIVMATVTIIAHNWTPSSSVPSLQTMKITKLTESGKVEYVAISPDGRYVAYAQRGSDGQALRLRQVGAESDIQILAPEEVSFPGITFSPDGSDIYFIRANPAHRDPQKLFVMPMLGGRPRQIMEGVDSPISFSPDRGQFVFTRAVPDKSASELRIANADGNGDRLLANIGDTFAFFQPGAAWSPDGRTIVATFAKKGMAGWVLIAVQAGDGSIREIYSSVRSIGTPRWLPDGTGLLLTLDDPLQLGQLWIIPFPRGAPRRVTNDISNYDPFIDVTQNGKAVALSQSVVHNLWKAPAADPSMAHQLTSGAMPYAQLVTTSDGKIVARSWDGELWIMNADGGERALIPGVSNAATLASCGRFLLSNSYRTAADELIRFDVYGTNINVITTGQSYGPTCSPDGRIAYYLELTHPQKILRMPIEGGMPEKVADVGSEGLVGRLSISPDGSLLACLYDAYSPEPARKIAIIPVDASAQGRTLDAPPGAARLNWSPDGKSFRFLRTQEGVRNLWEQSLAGGEPRQLTHFTSDSIVDYALSPDGHQLFFIRGYVSSDVVLLRNFR